VLCVCCRAAAERQREGEWRVVRGGAERDRGGMAREESRPAGPAVGVVQRERDPDGRRVDAHVCEDV